MRWWGEGDIQLWDKITFLAGQMIITGFSSLQACTDKSTVWCFQKVTGEVVYQIHAHSETISGTSEGGREILRERHYLVSSDPPRPQSELLCAWTTGDCRHR